MSKSDICAKHDNVEILIENRFGRDVKLYLVSCARCGDQIKQKQYHSDKEYLCDYCKLNLKEKTKTLELELLENISSKKEKAFDKAAEEVIRQAGSPNEYEHAIKLARRRAESFGSIPEAMVAIELVKLGYKPIPQQKINKYRVDFALPEIKMIIEVDGDIYHRNNYKTGRDAIINYALGVDWNIVHVSAELIAKDIMKLKAIIEKANRNTGEKFK